MDENKDLDDQIAKQRLKTKRIKKKVFMKKMLGIPDRNTAMGDDYGDEDMQSQDDQSAIADQDEE